MRKRASLNSQHSGATAGSKTALFYGARRASARSASATPRSGAGRTSGSQ